MVKRLEQSPNELERLRNNAADVAESAFVAPGRTVSLQISAEAIEKLLANHKDALDCWRSAGMHGRLECWLTVCRVKGAAALMFAPAPVQKSIPF